MYDEKTLFNQSMEVFFSGYEPLEEDNTYTKITSFSFDALCLLNKSDDTRLNIEPCFPSASVVANEYSATEAQFSALLTEMRDELKSYFAAIDQGGTEVKDENIKPEAISELAEFAATYNTKRNALQRALDEMSYEKKDDDLEIIEEVDYFLMDFDDKYAYVSKEFYSYEEKFKATHEHYRVAYMKDDEGIVSFGDAEEIMQIWVTAEEAEAIDAEKKAKTDEVIALMQSEHEALQERYNILSEEAEELRKFKEDTLAAQRLEAENSLFSKFDDKLNNVEGYEELKQKASEYSIEELEEKCNALFGKFALANATTDEAEPKKAEFAKTATDLSASDIDSSDKEPYGGIMESWKAKHQ